MQSFYLRAVRNAMARPVSGDPGAALQAFLTLNAAYFLGEWLPARTHAMLVRSLAARLNGVADLVPPKEEPAASQLAQHARELAAAFGPTFWTERVAALTEYLVPDDGECGDAGVGAALTAASREPLIGEIVDAVLLGHARRRLWKLAHPESAAGEARPAPRWALRLASRAAAGTDGRLIQAAEAALAEAVYGSF